MAMDNRERARRNRRTRPLSDLMTGGLDSIPSRRGQQGGPSAGLDLSLGDLLGSIFSKPDQPEPPSSMPDTQKKQKPRVLTAANPGQTLPRRDLFGISQPLDALGAPPDVSGFRQIRTLRDLADFQPRDFNVDRIVRRTQDLLRKLGVRGPSDLGGPSKRFQKLFYTKLLARTAKDLADREFNADELKNRSINALVRTAGGVLGTGLSSTASLYGARAGLLRQALAANAAVRSRALSSRRSPREKDNSLRFSEWLNIMKARMGDDAASKLAANTMLDAYLQSGREPPPELVALANRVFLPKLQEAADQASFFLARGLPWSDTALLRKANQGLVASQNPLLSALASGSWRFDPAEGGLVPVGPRFGVDESNRKPIPLDLTDPAQKLIADLFRLKVDGRRNQQ